ncbi:hypothetical protein DIPPA_06392 [Diplonema papillatum]|nr:hypothetical protein DIPPA_06392 [Diplonema papillatum]
MGATQRGPGDGGGNAQRRKEMVRGRPDGGESRPQGRPGLGLGSFYIAVSAKGACQPGTPEELWLERCSEPSAPLSAGGGPPRRRSLVPRSAARAASCEPCEEADALSPGPLPTRNLAARLGYLPSSRPGDGLGTSGHRVGPVPSSPEDALQPRVRVSAVTSDGVSEQGGFPFTTARRGSYQTTVSSTATSMPAASSARRRFLARGSQLGLQADAESASRSERDRSSSSSSSSADDPSRRSPATALFSSRRFPFASDACSSPAFRLLSCRTLRDDPGHAARQPVPPPDTTSAGCDPDEVEVVVDVDGPEAECRRLPAARRSSGRVRAQPQRRSPAGSSRGGASSGSDEGSSEPSSADDRRRGLVRCGTCCGVRRPGARPGVRAAAAWPDAKVCTYKSNFECAGPSEERHTALSTRATTICAYNSNFECAGPSEGRPTTLPTRAAKICVNKSNFECADPSEERPATLPTRADKICAGRRLGSCRAAEGAVLVESRSTWARACGAGKEASAVRTRETTDLLPPSRPSASRADRPVVLLFAVRNTWHRPADDPIVAPASLPPVSGSGYKPAQFPALDRQGEHGLAGLSSSWPHPSDPRCQRGLEAGDSNAARRAASRSNSDQSGGGASRGSGCSLSWSRPADGGFEAFRHPTLPPDCGETRRAEAPGHLNDYPSTSRPAATPHPFGSAGGEQSYAAPSYEAGRASLPPPIEKERSLGSSRAADGGFEASRHHRDCGETLNNYPSTSRPSATPRPFDSGQGGGSAGGERSYAVPSYEAGGYPTGHHRAGPPPDCGETRAEPVQAAPGQLNDYPSTSRPSATPHPFDAGQGGGSAGGERSYAVPSYEAGRASLPPPIEKERSLGSSRAADGGFEASRHHRDCGETLNDYPSTSRPSATPHPFDAGGLRQGGGSAGGERSYAVPSYEAGGFEASRYPTSQHRAGPPPDCGETRAEPVQAAPRQLNDYPSTSRPVRSTPAATPHPFDAGQGAVRQGGGSAGGERRYAAPSYEAGRASLPPPGEKERSLGGAAAAAAPWQPQAGTGGPSAGRRTLTSPTPPLNGNQPCPPARDLEFSAPPPSNNRHAPGRESSLSSSGRPFPDRTHDPAFSRPAGGVAQHPDGGWDAPRAAPSDATLPGRREWSAASCRASTAAATRDGGGASWRGEPAAAAERQRSRRGYHNPYLARNPGRPPCGWVPADVRRGDAFRAPRARYSDDIPSYASSPPRDPEDAFAKSHRTAHWVASRGHDDAADRRL